MNPPLSRRLASAICEWLPGEPTDPIAFVSAYLNRHANQMAIVRPSYIGQRDQVYIPVDKVYNLPESVTHVWIPYDHEHQAGCIERRLLISGNGIHCPDGKNLICYVDLLGRPPPEDALKETTALKPAMPTDWRQCVKSTWIPDDVMLLHLLAEAAQIQHPSECNVEALKFQLNHIGGLYPQHIYEPLYRDNPWFKQAFYRLAYLLNYASPVKKEETTTHSQSPPWTEMANQQMPPWFRIRQGRVHFDDYMAWQSAKVTSECMFSPSSNPEPPPPPPEWFPRLVSQLSRLYPNDSPERAHELILRRENYLRYRERAKRNADHTIVVAPCEAMPVMDIEDLFAERHMAPACMHHFNHQIEYGDGFGYEERLLFTGWLKDLGYSSDQMLEYLTPRWRRKGQDFSKEHQSLLQRRGKNKVRDDVDGNQSVSRKCFGVIQKWPQACPHHAQGNQQPLDQKVREARKQCTKEACGGSRYSERWLNSVRGYHERARLRNLQE